jgi:hypothetical protein
MAEAVAIVCAEGRSTIRVRAGWRNRRLQRGGSAVTPGERNEQIRIDDYNFFRRFFVHSVPKNSPRRSDALAIA